ncbi:MAG: MarR family transcriptional regulator, partial [Oscillospiraceae bacterium]|nr:MarR family transcriptional regulator [Oscillospiraceae bacterium]MBR1898108.1 MarR family transcriptional regulator [Oscillospiraceae bacterium]
ERCISVKELGQRLYLDSGTLTPVLKALEAKELITRRRSPEDERVLLAEVTEAGMQLREEALAIPLAMAGCVQLTPEEAAELYRLLYKVLGKDTTKPE